jgi:hypothetical protein
LIEGGFQILLSEENVLAFLRDTDAEQMIVVGNRGPGECPPKELFVRDGGIPDGITFTENFTGQTLTVQDGCLPLSATPVGVQIWQSIHSVESAPAQNGHRGIPNCLVRRTSL